MRQCEEKVLIFSNGCVPNRLGGKKIQRFIEESDLAITNRIQEADYIIFNSCGFSGDKVKESLDIIHTLKHKNKNAKLILTGCLEKIAPFSIDSNDFYKVVDIADLPEIFALQLDLNDLYISNNLESNLDTTKKDIYNIITSKGCVGNCTYCAIKKARGSISSKPYEEIISDFDDGIKRGFKKFILWGDDLGAYGVDINSSYVELINSLINSQTKTMDYKLFLHRLNPQWIINNFEKFLTLLEPKKIRMIYSPIQSGSNKILKLMKRSYRIEDVIDCFKEIKRINPSIIIKTDIMIGFPGETDEDFEKTLDSIAEIQFDDLIVFKYSGIKNTPAYEMKGQISDQEKNSRMNSIWTKFPFLRYLVDLLDDKYWLIDKKENTRKGPIQQNFYIL